MTTKLTAYLVLLALAIFQFWGCKKKDASQTEEQNRFSKTMTVDGKARTYTLNLPPTYYTGSDFSLVIALHGGGGDAAQFESTSKLTSKANAAQFIVVYPEGVKSTGVLGARSWNAGGCCDYAAYNNIDDVNFIRQLIDKLLASYKINPNKVYATGHSNGGMLAYRLACEIPDKIAAIAANGCTMVVTQACNPSRPVPVLHMHSVLDTKVPYQGGQGVGVGTSGVFFPSLDFVLNTWSLINTCAPARVIIKNSGYTLTQWSDCSNNVTIQYYLTKDGGHGWPGGLPGGLNSDTPSAVINANDLLWNFFQQYQLP